MALTGALADILAEKDRNLASVPDAFVDRMVLAQREMLAEVTALLGAFDRNGSLITVTKSNLIKAEEITDLLSQLFKGGEYFKAVETLADQFDQQALLSDEYFKIADPDFTVPPIANEVFLTRKAGAIDLLLGDGVSANVSVPIRRELINAVTTGASYSDTLKSLRNLIEGTPERDGVLSRYSRLIVSDTFAMTDRSYTQTIADEVGYDWFLYAGGIIDTTRPFCKEHNGRYYHRNEIEGWAKQDWQGKMYGTNESTIFVTAGGYNCQHSIMPVSVFAVPKADINRNIANGNFKPSAVEQRLLGGNVGNELNRTEANAPIKFGFDSKFDDYVQDIRGESVDVIRKLPKPYEIKSKGVSKGSYYRPSTTLTNERAGTLVSTERGGKRVFLHEYGHHVDNSIAKGSYNGISSQRSLFSDFKDARRLDSTHLQEKFKGENMFEEMAEAWRGKKEYNGASDIVDSMSNGRFYDTYRMPGHGARYYNRKGSKFKQINQANRQAEVFANLFEAYSTGGNVWLNMTEYFPNQSKLFEQIMQDFIDEK